MNEIVIKVSGGLACFSRPEMPERLSYPVMTPSAARGVLDAILWKKEFRWVISAITVLKPIRWSRMKRNEIGSRIGKIIPGKLPEDYFADEDRQQRLTTFLKDVAYLIKAKVYLLDRSNDANSPVKYIEMLRRRVEKGQHYRPPYLGIRECLVDEVCIPDVSDTPSPELAGEIPLGRMVYDVWDLAGPQQGQVPVPRMFQAVLRDGELNTDPAHVVIEGPVTPLVW